MDMREQGRKAEHLRKLHQGPKILVFPNAWDVASARVLEDLGYPAIATSSAAVAFCLGYPDGQFITRGEMLDMVGRIARAVRVPVTADMEAGYGTTVKDMAETAKATVNAGAVGLNLEDVTGEHEDTQVELSLQVEKMRVARVSVGSGVMRATLALVRRIGKELQESGTYSSIFDGSIPYAELNRALAARQS